MLFCINEFEVGVNGNKIGNEQQKVYILVTRIYRPMHVNAFILYDNNFEIKTKYYDSFILLLNLES